MNWQGWIPIFTEEVEEGIRGAPMVSPVHRTDHVLRVWKTSKKICESMGGDLEVMVAACLLHDLGRHHVASGRHGDKSAELAKPILQKHGFPKEKIPDVLKAIERHDHGLPTGGRESMESKILYDADKIDTFGVIGVYRHILFIEAGRIKLEDVIRLSRKRWDGLMLPESRKLAKADYEYIIGFFKALEKELDKGG